MSNCVFTGLDEEYWRKWGSSWVYTLREVAGYKGNAIIIDCGLSSSSISKIEEKNISLIKSETSGGAKIKSLMAIADYSKKNKGNFVYWDADVFFESAIDEVFSQIGNKIILSKNMNIGFIGAPSYHWVFIEDLVKFVRLTKKSRSVEDLLTTDFSGFVEYVSNTWNFIDLHRLEDSRLQVDGKKPIAIHPTGLLKSSLAHKKFLFHEREDAGYLSFIDNISKISKKLIKRT